MQSVNTTASRPKWSILFSMSYAQTWYLIMSFQYSIESFPASGTENVCLQLANCMIGSMTKVCVRKPGSQCPPCLYKSKYTSDYYCYNMRDGVCPFPHPDVICTNVYQPDVAVRNSHGNASTQNDSEDNVKPDASNARDVDVEKPAVMIYDSNNSQTSISVKKKADTQLSITAIILITILIAFMTVFCGYQGMRLLKRLRERRVPAPPFDYIRRSTVLSIEDGSDKKHFANKQRVTVKYGDVEESTVFQGSVSATASFMSDGIIAEMFVSKLEQSRSNNAGIFNANVSRMSLTETSIFDCDINEEEVHELQLRGSDTPMIELDLTFMEENCDYDIVDPETFYSSQIRTSEAIVEAGRYSAYSQVSSSASATFNFPCSLESNILVVD
uniref:AlNc14C28G2664 protein n=1 Tax=Albugo laibachii Nc14 TaxID=890382 RepID=F0W735_9STRA|nr:AlNc14C28G2664 [Albugo laibachii Nc14]|eukprot:CCA16934.1 AlNc14C28G2664 [Albugo laibachii Nc14]